MKENIDYRLRPLLEPIIQYKDKKYYNGKGIRWIISAGDGNPVSCRYCGNHANAVGTTKVAGVNYNFPICKKHLSEYLDKHKPDGWDVTCPCIVDMNLTWKP